MNFSKMTKKEMVQVIKEQSRKIITLKRRAEKDEEKINSLENTIKNQTSRLDNIIQENNAYDLMLEKINRTDKRIMLKTLRKYCHRQIKLDLPLPKKFKKIANGIPDDVIEAWSYPYDSINNCVKKNNIKIIEKE